MSRTICDPMIVCGILSLSRHKFYSNGRMHIIIAKVLFEWFSVWLWWCRCIQLFIFTSFPRTAILKPAWNWKIKLILHFKHLNCFTAQQHFTMSKIWICYARKHSCTKEIEMIQRNTLNVLFSGCFKNHWSFRLNIMNIACHQTWKSWSNVN